MGSEGGEHGAAGCALSGASATVARGHLGVAQNLRVTVRKVGRPLLSTGVDFAQSLYEK